jgi:hypothetical protein
MLEPQPRATLRASTACYKDNFSFTLIDFDNMQSPLGNECSAFGLMTKIHEILCELFVCKQNIKNAANFVTKMCV